MIYFFHVSEAVSRKQFCQIRPLCRQHYLRYSAGSALLQRIHASRSQTGLPAVYARSPGGCFCWAFCISNLGKTRRRSRKRKDFKNDWPPNSNYSGPLAFFQPFLVLDCDPNLLRVYLGRIQPLCHKFHLRFCKRAETCSLSGLL